MHAQRRIFEFLYNDESYAREAPHRDSFATIHSSLVEPLALGPVHGFAWQATGRVYLAEEHEVSLRSFFRRLRRRLELGVSPPLKAQAWPAYVKLLSPVCVWVLVAEDLVLVDQVAACAAVGRRTQWHRPGGALGRGGGPSRQPAPKMAAERKSGRLVKHMKR